MPKPDNIKTCKSCAWFGDGSTERYKTTCRYNPPTDNGFANTIDDWWCRNYEDIADYNEWTSSIG